MSIWHTTGSGKTLTSFKAAQILTEMPEVDKVVFVVDRADLDYQTTREFNAYSDGSVDGTHNTHKLVRQFTDPTRLIVTTIQKLNAAISKQHFLEQMEPLKAKRIIFIFDECHRSQFGDTHKRITSFFSNYQMFGFTGTPIFKDNANKSEAIARTTKDLFGECLHRYVITDAIRDQNVLRFSVEYWGKLRRRDGRLIDEKVAGIDTKEFFENPDRIESVVDWIIANHGRKTHNRDFTAIMAVGSVDALIQYYEFFARKKAAGLHDLRVVTIFTYGTNEDDKDANGLISEPEFDIARDTPVNMHSRDKLDSFITDDYNAMYGTSFSTKDSLSFYTYYKDIAKRIKERERENAKDSDRVDILLVVSMFLTGFDAKKVNTLYVDKNLKHHGLIQAYSRTNRILNEVKSQGNIVAFRNLKQATDDAIALFADKGANETILIDPYESYVTRFNEAVAALRILTPTVDAVDALEDENQQLAFVRVFRELARLRNILGVFAEFDWDELEIDNQTFDDFKSKYLDIYEMTRKSREEGTVSIVNDVDFEIELVRTDRINVSYILNLLREIKAEEEIDAAPSPDTDKRLSDIMDMVASEAQLRSKRDLIEKFIQQNMPLIKPDEDVGEAFKAYWDQEKESTLSAICAEEGLDREKFDKLVDHFNFSGQNPLRDDIVAALNVQPIILERRKIVNRILERLIGFIRTFEDDFGDV